MELYFKKPSKEARTAMCTAALECASKKELIKSAESAVRNLTGHKYSKIVNSGNSAIFTVMSRLKGKIMVPDQGGWSGFIKIAEFLNHEIIYLPTHYGLIDPDFLYLTLQKEKPKALFLTSFAGYTAEQPLKEIHQICKEEGVVLVEDASGALGDEKGRLANKKYADVIVASTGSPKIVNVGNGGVISSNQRELMDLPLRFLDADPVTCAGITEEIKNAPSILSETISACAYLKKELDEVFHKNKRGINVILQTRNTKIMARELRSSLNVHKGGMISKCPRYDRVMDKGIALEIKNLDTHCLTRGNLDQIVSIVNSLR
jgi:glycine/serine hydroxymethyltransferase